MSAVFFAQVYVRALRWRYLLPTDCREVSTRDLFDSIMVGQLANFILPFRAGEFARPAMLTKVAGVDFGAGFGSVVLERLFDLLAVLLTFALVVRSLADLPTWVLLGAKSLGFVALAILLVFLVALFMPTILKGLLGIVCKFFPAKLAHKVESFTTNVLQAGHVLRSARQVIMVILLTAIVWLGTFIYFNLTFSALGWSTDFFQAVSLTVIVALSVAAPSAPGFVGVYQTACVAGFVLFNRGPADGLAFSIVNHLLQYLLIVVVGTFTLYQRGLQLKTLRAPSPA